MALAVTLEGDGRTWIFLCHGLGGNRNGHTARAVTPALLDAGFSVCRFDFTGHGDSPGAPGNITLSRGLTDLKTVFERVAPRRFGLLGSSFGGAIAILFAAEHPETGALFLKSPVLDLRRLCDTALGPQGVRRWEGEGRIAFPHESGSVVMPWEFYADAARWDVFAAARRVKAPIETVHGDADRTVPVSRELPGPLHVLPGVGHRFLEPGALARVAELATDFFRRML